MPDSLSDLEAEVMARLAEMYGDDEYEGTYQTPDLPEGPDPVLADPPILIGHPYRGAPMTPPVVPDLGRGFWSTVTSALRRLFGVRSCSM